MKFRTSCFNPSIARNDLRRFWPLPLVTLLGAILTLVLPLQTELRWYMNGGRPMAVAYAENGAFWEEIAPPMWAYAKEWAYARSTYVVWVMAGLALISALLVFRHLHSRRETQFYLGLPLKRRCLYITQVVTGWAMVMVPTVIAALAMMAVMAVYDGSVAAVWVLLGEATAAYTLLYGLAVLACVLAGNGLGAVLVYGGMNSAVIVIILCAGYVASLFIPGLRGNMLLPGLTKLLTPIYMLVSAMGIRYENVSAASMSSTGGTFSVAHLTDPTMVVLCGIAGAALLVLGAVLYQIRRGENAGATIAFRPIKTLCKVLAALMVSAGGSVVTLSVMSLSGKPEFALLVLLVLAWLVLGWIAAEMIIQKSFRIFRRKSLTQWAVLAVILVAIMVGGKLDVTGYIHRMPDLTRVEQATLLVDGTTVTVEGHEALEIHETILENLDETSCDNLNQATYHIQITYWMAGDKSMVRSYYVPTDDDGRIEDTEIGQMVEETLMKPENNFQTWFSDWDITPTVETAAWGSVGSQWETVNGVDITILTVDALPDGGMLEPQQVMALYEAVRADILDGNMRPACFREWDNELGYLDLQFFAEPYDEAKYGNRINYENLVDSLYAYIQITDDMSHTLAALAEMDVTKR